MSNHTSKPVVLVTGASGGIGREAALQFAQSGLRVAVHYHGNAERAAHTMEALAGDGHHLVKGDISDADQAQQIVAEVVEVMGSIDVLVNNAGVGERHSFAECDYQTWGKAWARVLDTNLIGPANLCFCAAKYMMSHGGGRIVNVSSRGAFRGEPEQPWYGASKAGLNAMGQSMAQALAEHEVFVFTVAPGFVNTPMAEKTLSGPRGPEIRAQSPLGRVAQPEEVAQTVVYLGTEAPVFMTGSIVDVNGASYLRS